VWQFARGKHRSLDNAPQPVLGDSRERFRTRRAVVPPPDAPSSTLPCKAERSVQNGTVQKSAIAAMLSIVAGLVMGCANPTHTSAGVERTASTVPKPAALPTCNADPLHEVHSPQGETWTTATAPCSPTTTTSTTLPPLLQLGTSATLSNPEAPEPASVQITVNRIWTGAVPVAYAGSFTLDQVLKHVDAPAKVEWIGVSLSMVNTGQIYIGFVGASGPGANSLFIMVNGYGPQLGSAADTLGFADVGFYVGVQGCPNESLAGGGSIPSGQSASGCLAIPVPAGLAVSSVGFGLTAAIGNPEYHVAQWQS
jgi:hypothetical protein